MDQPKVSFFPHFITYLNVSHNVVLDIDDTLCRLNGLIVSKIMLWYLWSISVQLPGLIVIQIFINHILLDSEKCRQSE